MKDQPDVLGDMDPEQADELQCRARQWELEIKRGNRRNAYRLTDEALDAISNAKYETTLLGTPTAQLGFSMRITNLLEREDFRAMTFGAILSLDHSSLIAHPMVGPGVLMDIYRGLAAYAAKRCIQAEQNLALAGNGEKLK